MQGRKRMFAVTRRPCITQNAQLNCLTIGASSQPLELWHQVLDGTSRRSGR